MESGTLAPWLASSRYRFNKVDSETYSGVSELRQTGNRRRFVASASAGALAFGPPLLDSVGIERHFDALDRLAIGFRDPDGAAPAVRARLYDFEHQNV